MENRIGNCTRKTKETDIALTINLDGQGNNHHMAEALFKAFGKALDMAVSPEPRIREVWSTKGTL